MRFHQNNLLALSATPSKPKIDYTKFVMNFNGDTQYIFHTSYNDTYCGVSWIEDVLLDGQPYQKDYATLYSTYNSLARAPGGGTASQIVDVGGSNLKKVLNLEMRPLNLHPRSILGVLPISMAIRHLIILILYQ